MQKPLSQKTTDGWAEAQLLIAFHKDPRGKQRAQAKPWAPRKGVGRIHEDPAVQETFVEVRPSDEDGDPLQIKLRREEIVVTRENSIGWKGVVLREASLEIGLGDVRVSINMFGGLTWDDGCAQTIIDPDGTVVKLTPLARSGMSRDGLSMTRLTDDAMAAISDKGVVLRKRRVETDMEK
ncbi:hypothetical protein [Yoonia sp. SS1-5]|uniref:Uncharacterized protein n=1 Tax=Yoonia rhodophyticola TaxID=3137370 RepID=A0AAN0NKR6_9RHOB